MKLVCVGFIFNLFNNRLLVVVVYFFCDFIVLIGMYILFNSIFLLVSEFILICILLIDLFIMNCGNKFIVYI